MAVFANTLTCHPVGQPRNRPKIACGLRPAPLSGPAVTATGSFQTEEILSGTCPGGPDRTGRLRQQADNVVVLGLGASGTAAAQLAIQLGSTVLAIEEVKQAPPSAQILHGLGRESPLQFWWGSAPMHALQGCDLLVVSPGISMQHKFVQAALEEQIPVVSELAYAMGLLPPHLRTIAITGTNGKSTTTAFVSDMLRGLGLDVWMGGNFGQPVSCLAAAVACGEQPPDVAVIEVSSYQLEAPGTIEPYAAAILNLSADHLSRHGSMQEYARTKMRLVARMPPGAPKLVSTDTIAHARALPAETGTGHIPGLEHDWRSGKVTIQHTGWAQSRQLDLSGLQPVGRHNQSNAAVAAYLVSAVVGESRWDELQASVPRLVALPHRIQPVHYSRGVTWISDSKATNVNAAKVAVETLEGFAIILFGGQGKHDQNGVLGFSAIAALCKHHKVITFGHSAGCISAELLENGIQPYHTCQRLIDAVHHAKAIVKCNPGIRYVLLSPGCASFDEFHGFEDRGCYFAALAACDASPVGTTS
eukprot:jgi/Ulvmu1/4135/UM019_0114.1